MSVSVGGTAPTVGMNSMLERMGRQKAALVAGNSKKLEQMSTFLGPEKEGAQKRMKQMKYLLATLTEVPSYVKAYGKLQGASPEEIRGLWAEMAMAVAGGDSPQFAGRGGSYDPIDAMFSGDDDSFPMDANDIRNAKWEQLQGIKAGLMSPSPAFAQEMVMSSILPIAKEMIPNTVFTKAFITDTAVGELSKPYVKKKRHKAYQQGLAEESSRLAPSEIGDYETMLVTPREWRRPVSIDMKYVETMNFDVAADQLSDGGREMQVLIDQAGFRGLDTLVPNYGSAPASGSTTNGFVVDPTGTVMMLESGRNPQVEDLNFANQLLRNRGYTPDLIITSPFELGALMSEQAILMAYAYGNREVQETGLVGQLVGNAVAWTPNLYQGGNASSLVIWVVDSDELARIVLGHPISLYPDFHMRRLDFMLYTRLAIFFRNTNAVVKIVCANADAGIT